MAKCSPLLQVLVLFLMACDPAAAATIECGKSEFFHYSDDQAKDFGIPLDRAYCRTALMLGPIRLGDVEILKEWLQHEPFTNTFKVASPGGSIDAAMEMGRIIRARFISVWTYNHEPESDRGCSTQTAREAQVLLRLSQDETAIKQRQGVCLKNTDCRVDRRCCLSAWVLILAAGAWRDTRNIGLHRPSIKDFAEQHRYEEMRGALATGYARLTQYFKEMEISQTVLQTMMQIPPDDIRLFDWVAAKALFSGLPAEKEVIEKYDETHPGFEMVPSVYDWLSPRCAAERRSHDHMTLWSCLRRELTKEVVRRSKEG